MQLITWIGCHMRVKCWSCCYLCLYHRSDHLGCAYNSHVDVRTAETFSVAVGTTKSTGKTLCVAFIICSSQETRRRRRHRCTSSCSSRRGCLEVPTKGTHTGPDATRMRRYGVMGERRRRRRRRNEVKTRNRIASHRALKCLHYEAGCIACKTITKVC